MTTKQNKGYYAPDSSKYGTITDGAGTLSPISITVTGDVKGKGSQAPDGSIYFTLTDGSGNLA